MTEGITVFKWRDSCPEEYSWRTHLSVDERVFQEWCEDRRPEPAQHPVPREWVGYNGPFQIVRIGGPRTGALPPHLTPHREGNPNLVREIGTEGLFL